MRKLSGLILSVAIVLATSMAPVEFASASPTQFDLAPTVAAAGTNYKCRVCVRWVYSKKEHRQICVRWVVRQSPKPCQLDSPA